MTTRLRDSLGAVLRAEGFTPDGEWDGELRWTRPHQPVGLAIVGISTNIKHAPEYLGVNLIVGFRVPTIESAIETACGPMIVAGERQMHLFAAHLLHRAYRDPDRPKKRLPFPQSFTLWNVDFREKVIQQIIATIQRYALPYFDRIKTASDLKSIGMPTDSRAALLVWLGEAESALRLLDEELRKPKRYGPDMKERLERLSRSIRSGELQNLMSKGN